MSGLIRVDSVTKTFNAGSANEFTALHSVSVEIPESRITVLKGPSGSGKTSLLSLMGCMSRPTSGRIWLGDREITSLPERFLSEIRRGTFGFIFQGFNLIPGISALENVMLPGYPAERSLGALRKAALGILDRLGLVSKAGQKVERLSGGEQQRVAIARALMNDPRVIIADEPTAHLDTALAREILDTFRAFRAEGRTVVITSHDPLVFDSDIVDRTVSLRDGRVVEEVG